MQNLLPIVFAACLMLPALSTPSAADPVVGAAAVSPSRVSVGAGKDRAEVRAGTPVVFHNGSERATRVVFSRRDVKSVECAEGPGVSLSRRGQFTLEPGAEVACRIDRGDYRYATFTTRRGAVASDEARLRVR